MVDFQKAGFSQEEVDKKEQELGKDQLLQVSRFVSLKVIDTLWQDHLSNMEHMRESVKLRAYGGQDPLVEYKNEGRRLFSQLLNEIDFDIADTILKAGTQHTHPEPNIQNLIPNIGRNDFCPCGSGKKYKKCGMLNTEEHKNNMAEK
jgi:preprotein translocase subunit SecA